MPGSWLHSCLNFWTRMVGRQNLPVLHALLRRTHPNDGNAESVSSAHAAGSHFASQRMLAQNVLSCGGHTRMMGTRNLSEPHATPTVILPVSACSRRLYAPGNAAFSHFPRPSDGVWGFAPCLPPTLDLPHPNAGAVEPASSARDAGSPFASQRMLAQNVCAGQGRLFALSPSQ